MLTIELPENLDIEAATALKTALTTEDAPERAICIEAGEVRRVGTACIQVLLYAGRSLTAEGCAFSIRAPSPALLSACADMGLLEEMQSWSTD